MRRFVSIVAFALLAAAALGARAQTGAAVAPPEDVTEYTFPDEAVVGGLPGAPETLVEVRRPGKTRSLIKVRTNFVRALLKSVEDI